MSSLADLVRNAVATADILISSLQVVVSHSHYSGQDAYGSVTYLPSVPRRAVVDMSSQQLRTSSGELVRVKARVTFTQPLNPPVDSRDRIILPDGSTGPIVNVEGGVVDPLTNRPFETEVWIGV